jgi:choline monooxygenase
MTIIIDDDIQKASTLPGTFYCDPSVYSAQLEQLFVPSWQFVELGPQEGEAIPLTLLPGSLDEPIILSRSEGATHAFSNVCTHRGAVILADTQNRKTLRCGYHGRRFDRQGKFLSAPGFEGAEDFPCPADDLRRFSFGQLGPLHFVSMSPGVSFTDWIAPLKKNLPWFDWDALPPQPTSGQCFTFDANWALYCENYLEGFHVPFVHPGLSAVLALDAYEHELFPGATLQTARPSGDEPTLPDGTSAHYYWLFPNLMVNVYPWGLSLNVVEPLDVGRTRVSFFRYVSAADLCDIGAGADLTAVELEDEAIVLRVQRGVRSRSYDRGRYSPKHERGVHLFHRLLADMQGVSPT